MFDANGLDTQDEIRQMHKDGLNLMDRSRQLADQAESMFRLAKRVCQRNGHPRMKDKRGVCPDCGYDNRPDPHS